jgi:hypothetical protein
MARNNVGFQRLGRAAGSTILNTEWDICDGTLVPNTHAVKFEDGPARVEATYLALLSEAW